MSGPPTVRTLTPGEIRAASVHAAREMRDQGHPIERIVRGIVEATIEQVLLVDLEPDTLVVVVLPDASDEDVQAFERLAEHLKARDCRFLALVGEGMAVEVVSADDAALVRMEERARLKELLSDPHMDIVTLRHMVENTLPTERL